jgi:hypothetical protein
MSNRFLRAVLALYPRGFRRRYGPEVQGLVNDLVPGQATFARSTTVRRRRSWVLWLRQLM